MPDSTDPSTTTAGPTGWCHWHRGPSDTAVLIEIIERASGPGAGLYACAPCREQRPLVPLAERPHTVARAVYATHTRTCRVCGSLVHGAVRRCGWGAKLWQEYQKALHTTAAVS